MSEKKKTVLKLTGSLLILGLVMTGAYWIMRTLGLTELTREELQAFIESTGVIAPLIFIGISFLQVTFVPIPGMVTILAGSYVFGAGRSFLYSYIGMLSGAMFAYLLGKLVGRPFVNWLSGGQEKTDEWLKKLHGKENVLLFFMFLFPCFPDDLLCSVAGILPISPRSFFVMQIVTRLTSVGATLFLMSGEIIPFEGWGLVVLGAIAVVGVVAFVICFRKAENINVFFSDLVNKLVDKLKKKAK